MNFNQVTLVGRLTRDPETRQVGEQERTVTSFGLAVNTVFSKGKEKTAFVDCEAWGKTAETIGKWCTKGREVLVNGRLDLDTWEDKDGNRRSKLKVVVDTFCFGANAPQERTNLSQESKVDTSPKKTSNSRKVSAETSSRKTSKEATAVEPLF